MNGPMTVAVTGATGFVGRYVVAELLRRGHGVRALARDRAKAREVLPVVGSAGAPADAATRVVIVTGGVFDGAARRDLLQGANACIHLIGIIREHGKETFERVHVAATEAMTESCREAGVARFLHMSAIGVTPDGKAPYQRTKFRGEQAVRRSGLDWTIFRPALIHGPDGEFVQMMLGLMSGQEMPYYFIPYFTRQTLDTRVPLGGTTDESALVQPIAVEDVAWAFAEALGRGGSVGEVYNLVGPDVVTWPEVIETLRDELPGTDGRLRPWGVPGIVASTAAKAAGAIGLGGALPFDSGQAIMATEDATAETEKVRAHLGLTPRPFRAAVRGYAGRV